MIAFVSGTVTAVTLSSAVIDVGGVGVELRCAPATLAALHVGEPATLPSSLVVREDSLTLFGFADDDERSVFELLQTASGVGPRLAQAMLAVHTPEALRRAVATEDLVKLTAVPGIGRKGAQRIVLELKDRLGAPGDGGSPRTSSNAPPAAWQEQVRAALVGLGWSPREADDAVDTVAHLADQDDVVDVAMLLRAALQALSKA